MEFWLGSAVCSQCHWTSLPPSIHLEGEWSLLYSRREWAQGSGWSQIALLGEGVAIFVCCGTCKGEVEVSCCL